MSGIGVEGKLEVRVKKDGSLPHGCRKKKQGGLLHF